MDEMAEMQLRRAEVLADANRPQDALGLLASVRASDPGSARAHLLAARCLMALDRPGEAIGACDQAASSEPSWYRPHVVKSNAYRYLRNDDKAIEAGRIAVSLAPNSPDAHIALAQSLASSGDTEPAFVHVNTAVGLAPNSPEPYVALSYVALAARKWKQSEAAARQALSLNPNSSSAMNNLGVALRHRWHPLAAVHMFGGASRANPTGRVSQGNVNASILRLAGWVTCLLVATIVLFFWLIAASRQLSHPALVATFTTSAVLTAAVVVGGTRWFLRLPRAVRSSLRDPAAWNGTFKGKADAIPAIVARATWFVIAFFGIPMAFVLYLIWELLRVIQGSEHAVGESAWHALAAPVFFVVFTTIGRAGSLRRARQDKTGPPRR